MALAIHFHDQLQQPHEASLRDETLAGFAATPKWASPKFFYDRRGSELFEQICRQPEYYITRTEEQILAEAANDILDIARRPSQRPDRTGQRRQPQGSPPAGSAAPHQLPGHRHLRGLPAQQHPAPGRGLPLAGGACCLHRFLS